MCASCGQWPARYGAVGRERGRPDTDIFLTLGPNGANPFYVRR
jgi:hypothetical protein